MIFQIQENQFTLQVLKIIETISFLKEREAIWLPFLHSNFPFLFEINA